MSQINFDKMVNIGTFFEERGPVTDHQPNFSITEEKSHKKNLFTDSVITNFS